MRLDTIFKELVEMDNVRFKRYVKPHDAVGNLHVILIIFSDGSSQAFAHF